MTKYRLADVGCEGGGERDLSKRLDAVVSNDNPHMLSQILTVNP
jgi:hypothetical protein